MTILGVAEDVGKGLAALSRAHGQSLGATVLQTLEPALGTDERRRRLGRYAAWAQEDLEKLKSAETKGNPIVINDSVHSHRILPRLWILPFRASHALRQPPERSHSSGQAAESVRARPDLRIARVTP